MRFKKMEGDCVYLSPMDLKDISKYAKWINDGEISLALGAFKEVYTLAKEEETIEKMASEENACHLAIILKETEECIGNISLMEINHLEQCATIGLFIGERELLNQGLGVEAILLMLDFGFSFLNLHNIKLNMFSFNRRAYRAYQKVGFKEIGRRREVFFLDGKRYDEIYMDILDREFKESDYYKNRTINYEGYHFE